MIRTFVRWILIVTGLLLVPIMLIRAQPYTANTLENLLIPPPDCASPCFLGVQPGLTTATDAFRILEAHPWIHQVIPSSVRDIYRIDFEESFLINAQAVLAPLMRIDDTVVTWIFWRATPITRGELFLTLGPPQTMRVIHDNIEGILPLIFAYPDYNLSIVTPLTVCTLTPAGFWQSGSDWNGVYIGDIGPASYFALSSTGLLLPSSELESDAWIQELRGFEDCLE